MKYAGSKGIKHRTPTSRATLNRFLSLHYLLPFIIAGNSVVHLAALHEVGSNHPLVGANPVDKSAFFTDSLIKDLVG